MRFDYDVELKAGDLVQSGFGFDLYLCEEFPKTLRGIKSKYIERNIAGIVLRETRGTLLRIYIDGHVGWAHNTMFERIREGTE